MKLTAEQRIERAHVRLMQSPEFCLFAGTFMVGKVIVDEKTKTAKTNGRDVVYGRAFVDSLDEKELAFLVVHEAMHKAYRHLTTWAHLTDKRRANRAMDYVINLQIVDCDKHEAVVAMPRKKDTGEIIGLIDEKYRGMDTHQVYELLEDEGGGGKGGDGEGGGSDQGGEGQTDSKSDSLDDHDWDAAQELTEEEKQELEREIDAALREGAILAGKLKGNVPRGIEELLHPKVDWVEATREFIKLATRGADQSTWRRPNRRFLGCDIVMPSTQAQKAECLAIGVDTSGSIVGAILGRFLGEIKSVCDEVMPEKVELMYWDSHVAGHETYEHGAVALLTDSTKPRGGGGTDPDCVPAFMADKHIKPQCLIMLTDGEFYKHDASAWANLGVPVLWCVVGKKDFVPKVGQTVCVE